MTSRAELLAEAYRRNLLPPAQRGTYEEAVRRGVVQDAQASGRLKGRGAGLASGVAATINEAIPGMDEVAAGLGTALDVARGKGSIKQSWKRNRDLQTGLQQGLRDKSPLAADLATGAGYAAQAVPALLSGGASAAPQAGNIFARAVTGTARNATIGASYAAGNELAGRGTVRERVGSANRSMAPGAIAGVAAPAAVAGVSKGGALAGKALAPAGRATIRAANNVASRTSMGPFLDPRSEALTRLGETLKADGFNPSEIQGALSEWTRVGGPTPAFMDLIANRGQRTMGLIRGAAMGGGGRNRAVQYGNQVAVDLQDNAIARTRQLTPDQRTVPEVEADIAGRISTHSQAPQVQPGRGGALASARLNRGFDEGQRGVNAAYDAARASNPEQAQLPRKELPQLAANVRESVRDFHPEDVPSVTRELATLDGLNAPTVRDLYEMRQRLSAVRASKPDQALAASRAVRALDGEIEAAVQRGSVTGDPEVVGLWRNAIGQRREFGRQYEGDDLIQKLTEREVHGAGRTNAVAQEDASNVILGRNGVSPRLDLHRDLARMRDTLGPESPEWEGLRQEALSRVLGRDANTENYGQAWTQFQHQNPELARLLMSPQDAAALTTARGNIGGAVADREALASGRGILNVTPDQYAADAARTGERRPLNQLGAARSMEDAIGRPADGATGVLNRIGSATNTGRNLETSFGAQPAADYRQAIRQTVDQVNNARFINPNTGSQTAGRLSDEALVESIPTSKTGLVMAVIRKVRRGATLTDAEREALVQIATSRAQEGANVFAPMLQAPVKLPAAPRQTVTNLFAIPAHENNR